MTCKTEITFFQNHQNNFKSVYGGGDGLSNYFLIEDCKHLPECFLAVNTLSEKNYYALTISLKKKNSRAKITAFTPTDQSEKSHNNPTCKYAFMSAVVCAYEITFGAFKCFKILTYLS